MKNTYFIDIITDLKENDKISNISSKNCKLICQEENIGIYCLHDIFKGAIKSCGCLKKETARNNIRKLNTKYTFGYLKNILNNTNIKLIIDEPNEKLVFDVSKQTGFICHCGNKFYAKINTILNHNQRISCGCVISRPEINLFNFVKSFIPDATHNNRTIISPYELDVYIPNLKLGIEFCGLYWHGEKRNKENARTKHLLKYLQCEEKGLHLITIFEDEWINKRKIIESLIKSKLGVSTATKIGARDCNLIKCYHKDVKNFINQNHIQGASLGGVSYALIHDNKVVACAVYNQATLSRNISLDENSYELSRYCVSSDFIVVGGLQRIQKQFIKDYKPKQIISYSDNRYFTGQIYPKLGFKFVGLTKPSYFYFKDTEFKRYHRFNFRKNILVQKYGADPAKTEWQIMQEMGYDRIWDCGTKKWILTLS